MKPQIEIFEVILSNQCNLKCKYCYVCQNVETISIDNLDKIINWIQNYPNKDPHYMIHFFGGEPLCNKELIKYFVEHYPSYADFLIFTNGTLFDRDFLEWARQYSNIGFNISLDGYKSAHNINRIFQCQIKYFFLIFVTIKYIIKKFNFFI